jgi:hypothetical protein
MLHNKAFKPQHISFNAEIGGPLLIVKQVS